MRPEKAVFAIHNDETEPNQGPLNFRRGYHNMRRDSMKAAASSRGRRWVSMELTDTTTDQTSISVMPAIFNGPCQQEEREETEKEVQKVVVLMIRCT